MSSKDVKQSIRRRIWTLMEERNIAAFPRPVYGRIPNFKGAVRACERLATLDIFKRANVVKVNPDSPQRHIRYLALSMGKIVIMPTPRLRQGFLLLDPAEIPRREYKRASTIAGAFRWGDLVKPWDLPKVDLVIIGLSLIHI